MNNEKVVINPYDLPLSEKSMSQRQKDYNQRLAEAVALLYKDRYMKKKK